MTVAQLGILACLLLSLCGVLFGGYSVLNYMVASVYAPAGPVDTGPSPTLAPSPTSGPTLTPSPSATPTPLPYEALIPPGSSQYTSVEAPGVEIWLPAGYVARKDKDKGLTLAVFSANDDDARTVLALRDTAESPYLVYTTLFVAKQPMRGTDFDQRMTEVFAHLGRTGQQLERHNLEIFDLPAVKLVFDVKTGGVEAGLVVYGIHMGDTVWYIGFTTPFNELYTRMIAFDQAAQTFRFIPPTPTPSPTPTVPTATNTPLP